MHSLITKLNYTILRWFTHFLISFKCFFRFVSTDDKKAQGAKRDNEVLIQRRKTGGLTVPYRIIDSASKLTTDDW